MTDCVLCSVLPSHFEFEWLLPPRHKFARYANFFSDRLSTTRTTKKGLEREEENERKGEEESEKSNENPRNKHKSFIQGTNMFPSGGSRLLIRRISSRTATSRLFCLKEERLPSLGSRYLSSKQPEDEGDADKNKTEDSLKDTIRKMRQDGNNTSSDDDVGEKFDGFLRSAAGTWSTFSEEVGKTWGDLLKSGERKSINKKIAHPEDTVEGEAEYTGPVEIMVIDESEHLTAWERMQRRLTEAPIISGNFSFFVAISS